MILKDKILIDFKVFFSQGKFDFLKLSNTKKWIINNFPDPDGYSEVNDAVYKSDIWTYGNIELHFDKEQQLFLIFSDYIKDLNGGNHLKLDKWFLEDTDNLKLSDILKYLNEEHIDYRKKTICYGGEVTVEIELNSGVSLGFMLEEFENEDYDSFINRSKTTNQNEFEMISFSLMERNE